MGNQTKTPPNIEEVYASPKWNNPTRYVMSIFMVVAGILIVIVLLPISQAMLLAFTFALILFYPSRWIARHTPLKYPPAVILVYVIVVLVLVFGFFAIVPGIIGGVNSLVSALQQAYDDLTVQLENDQPETSTAGATTDATAPPEEVTLRTIIAGVTDFLLSVTRITASLITSVAGFVGTFGLGLFVSFLLLLDLPMMQHGLSGLIPPEYRREFSLMLFHLDSTWEGFLRGQVLVGLIQGVSAFIIFKLMGLPGAGILAILDGTLGLIPSIGGIIAGIPVAIVGLLLGSTVFVDMSNITFTILVFTVNIIVSQIIFTFVSPIIMSKQVNLPVIFVIVGVFVGFSLGGILGALLVVPIISSLRLILGYVLTKITNRDPFPGEAMPKADVRGFFSQIFHTYSE